MPIHLIDSEPAAYFYYLITFSKDLKKEINDGLRLYDDKQYKPTIFGEVRYFSTEASLAAKGRLQMKKRLGNMFLPLIYFLASENYDRYNIANRWLVKTATYGRSYINNRQDEDMQRFLQIFQAVRRERHRFLGLTRFEELDTGALYAEIAPTYRLAPLLGSHFQKRLGHRPFAICDVKRKEALLFDGQRFHIGSITGQRKRSPQEADFQDLWRTYHRHIAIEARKNRALQKQQMPVKYWQQLTEMQAESLLTEEKRQEGNWSR